MAQITETITDIQTQVLDALDKVEAPVVDIVKNLAEKAGERLPAERPELPVAPAELLELVYGFAQMLLDNQHDFAKAIVGALSPVLGQPAKAAARPKVAKAA